jgi:hypothetical protein
MQAGVDLPAVWFNNRAVCLCRVLQVPIALVSLVDTPVQWFKSAQGLGDVDRTARNTSFCAW